MDTTDSRPRTRRALKLAAVLVLLLAIPASASHRFDDVPTGAGYHDEVNRLADAGITAGCDGNSFCTTDTVTRWQMAYFLDRLAPRSASATSVSTFAAASGGGLGATPVTVDLRSGGTGSATGHVNLQGSVTVTSNGATCPCEVEAFLYRVRDETKVGSSVYAQLPATTVGNAGSSVTLALAGGGGQGAARTETYAIGVFINNGTPGNAKATGNITATWTAYDGG